MLISLKKTPYSDTVFFYIVITEPQSLTYGEVAEIIEKVIGQSTRHIQEEDSLI